MGARNPRPGGASHWKVVTDLNRNSVRVSSFEDRQDVAPGVDKLPLDLEIFQNLVDNICRKFDPSKGENLLCFGGCAVFNSDGSLRSVESFLPQLAGVLGAWLEVSPCLHAAFTAAATEQRVTTDSEVKKVLWQSLLASKDGLEDIKMERSLPGRTEGECYFRVTVPEQKRRPSEEAEVEDPTRAEGEDAALHSPLLRSEEPRRGRRKCKYKTKSGVPVPPRPVLSLTQEQVHAWFPALVEKLGGKRFPTCQPRKFEAWDGDVDAVLTMKDFTEAGPGVALDWAAASTTFCWKLKLAAAIILDKKGLDYTTFAEEVEEKHEKYSINDLKLMSMSKNPETFEKLFVKNGLKDGGKKKPDYLDEFERKSSEIVLQNLRLINARDKRINGNSLPRPTKRPSKEAAPPPPPPLYHQRIPSQQEVARAHQSAPAPPSPTPPAAVVRPPPSPLRPAVKVEAEAAAAAADKEPLEEEVPQPQQFSKAVLQKMPALKPIDDDYVFDTTTEDLSSLKQKRKKSSESKEAKPLSQKYMCKNNFQKGDFLIHPSQLHGPYGPVKQVTFRRETKKVFLSVSEFETVSFHEDEVVLEKSSHKSRSTPAKFLDSYIRINEAVQVLDKRPDGMRIKRKLPKSDEISRPVTTEPAEAKPEITDDDTEDSKESLEDDSEMVIDET